MENPIKEILTNATEEMILEFPEAPMTNLTSPVLAWVITIGDMEHFGRFPGCIALAEESTRPYLLGTPSAAFRKFFMCWLNIIPVEGDINPGVVRYPLLSHFHLTIE